MAIFPKYLRQHLRIIWTVAAKDIVDAIRNKTTLSVILGVLMFTLSSQALPLLTRLSTEHRAVVYAQDTALIAALKKSDGLQLRPVASQQELEQTLSEAMVGTLGLVIPAPMPDANPVRLDGYRVHWVAPSELDETRALVERRLTALAEVPVQIDLTGHAVYPQPNADGRPLMAALALANAILIMGAIIVPYAIIEEKETHTLDALLVSPATAGQVIAGKAVAGLVYGLLAAGVVLLFNGALVVHWGIALLAVLSGTCLAVAVGLWLGSLFDNPQTMGLWMGLVLLVLLGPILLAQAMSANWPALLRAVMPWVPTVHMSRLFRISFAASVPFDQVLVSLGLMGSSTALLLALASWKVRRQDR